MKNLIPNVLTVLAFGIFFLMATATSQDECFYNMGVTKTDRGLTIINNNDFQYVGLQMRIEKTELDETQTSGVNTIFSYELNGQDIGIGATREFLFQDFRADDTTSPSDTISGFLLTITGSSPEDESCFFDQFF